MCDVGRGGGRPEIFSGFPRKRRTKTLFHCIYTRRGIADARRGCERVSGDCGGEKNRIFPHDPCDEPPLIFVYRSRGGVRRWRWGVKKSEIFPEIVPIFNFFADILCVRIAEAVMVSRRRGMKKSRIFLENRSPFSESPTDIPYVQIWLSGTSRGWRREKKYIFLSIQVGVFSEKKRRDSMGEKKNATFFGNLYRISVFLLIYRMCGIGRGRRMTRKSGVFSENLCRISLLSPDIPCVRNRSPDGRRRKK